MNLRDRKNEKLKRQWWEQKDIYEAAYHAEREIEEEEDRILVRNDHESLECLAKLDEINQRYDKAKVIERTEYEKLRSIERKMPQWLVKHLEGRWEEYQRESLAERLSLGRPKNTRVWT